MNMWVDAFKLLSYFFLGAGIIFALLAIVLFFQCKKEGYITLFQKKKKNEFKEPLVNNRLDDTSGSIYGHLTGNSEETDRKEDNVQDLSTLEEKSLRQQESSVPREQHSEAEPALGEGSLPSEDVDEKYTNNHGEPSAFDGIDDSEDTVGLTGILEDDSTPTTPLGEGEEPTTSLVDGKSSKEKISIRDSMLWAAPLKEIKMKHTRDIVIVGSARSGSIINKEGDSAEDAEENK